MEIGLSSHGASPLPQLLAEIETAAAQGFSRFWLGEHGGCDPLTVFAALGDRAPGIEVGTSVIGTYQRHPFALAAQALTAHAATGGRLTLGIGPSHGPTVEGRYGMTWQPPARHSKEVLDILIPTLRGESVDVHSGSITATGGVSVPDTPAPSVLLGANGPRMLKLAGERAGGALAMWATPQFVGDVVAPTVTAGNARARIVVGILVAVKSNVDSARDFVGANFQQAATLPTFQALLDRQGVAGPEDTLVAGDEAAVEKAVGRFADAGATELFILPVGGPEDQARTVELFAHLAKQQR